MLSYTFTKAIEWGVIDDHLMAGKKVTKNPPSRRTRYVEDWEVLGLFDACSPFLKAYVGLRLAMGLRKADMLAMKIQDITELGISVTPRKTFSTTGRQVV